MVHDLFKVLADPSWADRIIDGVGLLSYGLHKITVFRDSDLIAECLDDSGCDDGLCLNFSVWIDVHNYVGSGSQYSRSSRPAMAGNGQPSSFRPARVR